MKGILRVAAVSVGAIVLFLLVGTLRHDVPAQTPGAVVENFVRHVSRDRYAKAKPLLSSELEGEATPEALAAWEREARSGLGEVRRVRGETDWVSGEEGEATAILETEQRERRLRFALKREEGKWVIARLDQFWGDASTSAGSIRIRESWRNRAEPPRR